MSEVPDVRAASSRVAPGSGAMFDGIAERYDLLNRLISLGLDRGWRRAAVRALELPPDGIAIDLATGTADLALETVRQHPRARVIGIDTSARMLARGLVKLRRGDKAGSIALIRGDAQRLPLPDGVADGVMIAFGIRNVPDRLAALREMARITRPGGRVAILELGEPAGGPLAPLARAWTHHAVPLIGAILSGHAEYRYLQRSVAAFPRPAEFARLMREAGLSVLASRPFGFGACRLFVGGARTTGG